MPDLETIVNRMIAAGESEDNIATIIRGHKKEPPRAKEVIAEPDNFFEGFSKSLFSGEALKAGLKGAAGFAKGAVADIPETLLQFGKDALEVANNPRRIARESGGAFREGIPEVGKAIKDMTLRAGSEPEAFGRMVGQFTGQPAVMAGVPHVPKIPGAINRIPRVNQALSATGRALEGARPANNIPTTPRGVVAGAIRGVASPVGRGLQRIGERGRLGASKVETANELAKRAPTGETFDPDNPFVDIVRREQMRQGEADNIPPILESPDELAARSPESPRSAFSEDVPVSEVDPIFRSEPQPPPGSRLTRSTPLTPEEEMAAAVQEVRNRFAREPGVEAPPPPFSLGEGAPPTQPRVTVKAPKSPVKKEPKAKAEPPKEEFKPTTDPKETVDPTTGEIVETPTTMEQVANVLKSKGIDFKELVRKSRAKWNLADLGDDAGSASIPNWAETVAELLTRRKKAPTNPLRPEVPEGQVTNRSMFDRSALIEAENRAARAVPEEAPIIPHEFSEDMAFLPEELTQPDIPQFSSPYENQFDPRVAPGGVASNPFEGVSPTFQPKQSFADIEARMYELTDKGTAGTLTAEELAEAQALNKVWRNHPEFDTPTPPLSFADRQKQLLRSETGSVGKDVKQRTIGQPSPLASRLVKDGSVVRTQVKDVGPRGQTFKVTSPDGKVIGEVAVTNERVSEVLKAYGDDSNPDDIAKLIYETDLDDVLEQAGYTSDDLPRMKVEPIDNRKTKVARPAAPKEKLPYPFGPKEDIPEFPDDALAPPTEFPNDTLAGPVDQPTLQPPQMPLAEPIPKIKPDEAFGPGGDISPIAKEAQRLASTKAADSRYKVLLPKEMRTELMPGETYKGKLERLIQIVSEQDAMSPENASAKIAERDAFLEQVR